MVPSPDTQPCRGIKHLFQPGPADPRRNGMLRIHCGNYNKKGPRPTCLHLGSYILQHAPLVVVDLCHRLVHGLANGHQRMLTMIKRRNCWVLPICWTTSHRLGALQQGPSPSCAISGQYGPSLRARWLFLESCHVSSHGHEEDVVTCVFGF